MLEALPEDFSQKLYPEGVDLMVSVKTCRDKLYYMFEAISGQLRERNELYTEENLELAKWMLLLLNLTSDVFPQLFRI